MVRGHGDGTGGVSGSGLHRAPPRWPLLDGTPPALGRGRTRGLRRVEFIVRPSGIVGVGLVHHGRDRLAVGDNYLGPLSREEIRATERSRSWDKMVSTSSAGSSEKDGYRVPSVNHSAPPSDV